MDRKTTIDLSRAYREGVDYLKWEGVTRTSLRDIAAQSGLARETVHQISRNKGDPKLSTLIAIADAFGLSIIQFLDLGTVIEPADRKAQSRRKQEKLTDSTGKGA